MRLTPNEAVLALLVVLVVTAAAGRALTRRRPPTVDVAGDYLERAGVDRIPHATALPGWVTAVVIFAAVVGAIAAGVAVTQPSADRARNDTAQAQTNRSTCLSALAANGRFAVDVLGVLITTPKGAKIDAPIAAHMGLPRDVKQAAVILRARFAAVALDDKRIGDDRHPICPFAPGDPDGTPTKPVDSQTALLEATLRRTGHP